MQITRIKNDDLLKFTYKFITSSSINQQMGNNTVGSTIISYRTKDNIPI